MYVCNQSLETQVTTVKGTNAGGRTKEANEISIVYVHQHGGDDVTCKPLITGNFHSPIHEFEIELI